MKLVSKKREVGVCVYRRQESGFTLVELLVVIMILAVLAAVSMPIMNRVMDSARQTKAKSHMKMFVDGATRFKADHGSHTNGIRVQVNSSFRNDSHSFTSRHRTNTTMTGNYWSAWGEGGCANFIAALTGGANPRFTNVRTQRKGLDYLNIPEVDKGGTYFHSGLCYNTRWGHAHGFKDPWGYAYSLLIDFTGNQTMRRRGWYMGDYSNDTLRFEQGGFALISRGPDRAWGGGDDVASWR